MSALTPLLVSKAKVLLFGPQALAFHESGFQRLRDVIISSQSFEWVLNALEELPTHWEDLARAVPKLRHTSGGRLLYDLNVGLRSGEITKGAFPLPNLLLTPLVVTAQLLQYTSFIEGARLSSEKQQELQESFSHSTEAVGLCTGLLSALAVSSSGTEEELQRYGSVAIRLAMVIGALVDAQDTLVDNDGDSRSFSITWNTAEAGTKVEEILGSFLEVWLYKGYEVTLC